MKSSKSTSKSMVSTSSTLFYVYGLAPDCARVQNHREYPISMLEMQMEHFFFFVCFCCCWKNSALPHGDQGRVDFRKVEQLT